jgi:hypothetical protein
MPYAVSAADLSGVAQVNLTSDTGANAKNMAMAEARRQILSQVLSPHVSDAVAMQIVMADTKDAALVGLISATNVTGEKVSDTSYAADIKMTVDGTAAALWLAQNGIENSLNNDAAPTDKFIANIELSGALREWIDLARVLRESQIVPDVRRISGARITIEMPLASRGAFVSAVRNAGWTVADTAGFLQVRR